MKSGYELFIEAVKDYKPETPEEEEFHQIMAALRAVVEAKTQQCPDCQVNLVITFLAELMCKADMNDRGSVPAEYKNHVINILLEQVTNNEDFIGFLLEKERRLSTSDKSDLENMDCPSTRH